MSVTPPPPPLPHDVNNIIYVFCENLGHHEHK